MLLQLEGVAKRFKRGGEFIDALSDFTLAVPTGERLGLLGPNGAGKSTLLKIICRLCEPDAGSVRFQGEPMRQGLLGRVGLLLEGRGAINERLTTWENARYFCGLREQAFDAAHTERLARLLDLPSLHQPVRQFSTGNKLRAALLLTVVHRPTLLLLDEPTLGLDVFGVERLHALLDAVQAEGTAVMLSSHDLSFVEQSAARIVCISAGKKRFDGQRSEFVPAQSGYMLRLRDPERLLGAEENREWSLPDHEALTQLLQQLQPTLPRLQQLQVQPLTLAERYRALLEEAH
jgi:ABC-2 type transport system ATP-binding protein